ncbi:MAG: type 2 lanthipeptide synthetase LanM family protein [Calothrix sp. MO_192.B10]|nr:type 2 lanthipeptide synthetase LanM family protein [Calothrix sp. MO_192.B10]
MNIWQSATWYQGLSLRERITDSLKDEFDFELAMVREKRWLAKAGFEDDLQFAQKLKNSGINLCQFRYILSESSEELTQRIPTPPWLGILEEVFNCSQPPQIKIVPPTDLPIGKEIQGFLYSIEPLISRGIDRLNQGIEELFTAQPGEKSLPFDVKTITGILFAVLPEKLLEILTPTMVLELNVARLQGLLSGETPRERFVSFLQHLYVKDGIISILQEYPVLARQLVICLDNWVDGSLEFLQRLCADWDDICRTLGVGGNPGVLVEVKGGISDSHGGGRGVIIAKFSSGLQVVYKPKSLAVDGHFQELLNWVNGKIKLQVDVKKDWLFPELKIINRGSYGWVEFVEYKSCDSQAEVERFYLRIGGYLALLYMLEATDFHGENLIACGENPVLVDLESLFHSRLHRNDWETGMEYLNDSVLRVGLLPQRLWGNSQSEGVDISGMGSAAGQVLPHGIRDWGGIGTDEMRLQCRESLLEGEQNQPHLHDKNVNILNYIEEIIEGFITIYNLLLEHRQELLHEEGLINKFADDEVRVILRPTRTYALLLQDSYHPDVLRNGLDRDRYFDKLWMAVKYQPYLATVISSEETALWRGDIPMFTTRPCSRDVITCNGEYLQDFLTISGIELVRNRLQKFNPQDLQRQLWFIRASLTTLTLKNDTSGWKTYSFTPSPTLTDNEEIINNACAIGKHLQTLALGNQEAANWIGLTLVGGKRWSLLPLGWSLYDGLPGVILFLAYLSEVTQDTSFARLATAGLTTLQKQLVTYTGEIRLIGGFSGWGGVIYTLTHLGVLWERWELLQAAVGWVEKIRSLIPQNKYFDIVDGTAGCLVSLLSLYRCVPCDLILDNAIKCGLQLLQNLDDDTKAQGGFAHGTGGISWAFLKLWEVSQDVRFHVAASEIINYERHHQSRGINSFDIRDFSGVVQGEIQPNPLGITWCNGATGIGLGRLGCLKYLDDSQIRREISSAINITLKQGFGLNHSLCHGDLGNLELLLKAREILENQQWDREIQSISSSIITSIKQYGWLCGVPLGVETPGLMTGLAGIGYGLLRLAKPEMIPSILMLESPVNVVSSSLVVK